MLDIKRLREFEDANERLKQAITEYQAGTMRREALLARLKELTTSFSRALGSLGAIGEGFCHRLEQACEAIPTGRDEFIVRDPISYHKTAWEAHRLLVDAVKKGGLQHYKNKLVGWKSYRCVPVEVRGFSKHFPASAVFLRTDVGWAAYVSPGAGGLEDHFTTVRKVVDRLEGSLSDFMDTRTNALKDILSSLGFKITGTKKIPMGKIGDTDSYNYILDIEGASSLLGALVEVLFRSQHMVFLRVHSWAQEDARRRETRILKHLLQEYLKQPGMPYVEWGDIICDSDLQEILGYIPENDALKLINNLLKLPFAEFRRVIRKKYHYPDWLKHYHGKEDLVTAGVADTLEEADEIWAKHKRRRDALNKLTTELKGA